MVKKKVIASKQPTAGARLFSEIVLGPPLSGAEAIKVIRNGYAVHMLKSASSFLGVPNTRIQRITHVTPTTASRLEKASSNMDQAASERVFRMASVTRMAISVFEDVASATEWMRQPNHVLGNVAPIDLMDTEPGADAVRLVLNAIATGGVA